MTELELLELKLKVIQLEKEKTDNDELVKLLTRAVNSFATFQDQFKNGDGIVPKIIDGLTNNFKNMFNSHREEVLEIISKIPCSKLIGNDCDFRFIGKDEKIPEGWKAIRANI